jgi:hypothetical protein
MTAPVSHFPTCSICNKPVTLETTKTDERGRTVHEGCYVLKIGPKRTRQKASTRGLLEYTRISPITLVCPRCNAKPGEVCEVLTDAGLELVHIERIKWAEAMDVLAKRTRMH